MIALYVLIALLLLLLMPVGVHIHYDAQGFRCVLLLGPFRYSLIPSRRERRRKKKALKAAGKEKPKKEEKTPGGSLEALLPYYRRGLTLLRRMLRKLHVRVLTIHVGFGGQDDPAVAAVQYGSACAAIGAIAQPLRQWLHIEKENISASCDFTREGLTVTAELKTVIVLCELLTIVIEFGIRALRIDATKRKTTGAKLEKGGADT